MTQSFDPSPQPPTQAAIPDDRALAMQRLQAAIAELTRRMKSGANNFYWIAALSVINSLILGFGGNSYFVVGLAGTLIVDSIFVEAASQLPDAAIFLKLIGLAISIVIAGIFALFGFFASKGKRWAFITGMIFYGLDAVIMLLFQDWIGVLFHGFFLWGLFGGLRALNELHKLAPPQPAGDFPQSIGM